MPMSEAPPMSMTTVQIMHRASTHPTRKAGPLVFAFLLKRMRMTAMMGTGLMATPMACERMSPIALPIAAPFYCRRSCILASASGLLGG